MRDRRAASMRRPRKRERGNSLVLALIVLTALGMLSVLTVLSVRGGIQSTANDRFRAIALYAAESGGAAAMDYLRTNVDPTTRWSAFVDPVTMGTKPVDAARFEAAIPGNGIPSGSVGNPFSADVNAAYSVTIYNNPGDSGLVAGDDMDARVIVRSTGFGPDGAVAVIEWEVSQAPSLSSRPCQVYAQEGQSETNAGTNDCLGAVDTTQSATYTP